MATKIEWARSEDGTPGDTWNPVRGCTKISPGCTNCYAATFAERWRGVAGHPYEQGFDLRLVPDALDKPLKRKKPTTYFVNSMSDLFHEEVPDEYIDKVVAVAAVTPHHTYQCLTKRADRAREYWDEPHLASRIYQQISRWLDEGGRKANGFFGSNWDRVHDQTTADTEGGAIYEFVRWKLPILNWWQGVSVENRKHGLPRIEHLRQTPAAVRFLSIEPLLEDLGQLDLTGIGWVIVGGESGHGARPMQPAWPRSLRDQCVAAGVPYFFKQWGEFAPADPESELASEKAVVIKTGPRESIIAHGSLAQHVMIRVGKKAAGRMLDGRLWDEMPNQKASTP